MSDRIANTTSSRTSQRLILLGFILLAIIAGLLFTILRGDFSLLDPQLIVGLTGLTALSVLTTKWWLCLAIALLAMHFRNPLPVLALMIGGLLVALATQHVFARNMGLATPVEMGLDNAAMMHAPILLLIAALGALIGTVFSTRRAEMAGTTQTS